jgi:hypothetical protein
MRLPLGLDVRLAGGQPQIIRKATREINPELKEADIQPVKKARGGGGVGREISLSIGS